MKIGFYIKWAKGTFNSKTSNVLGDELYGEAMCRSLSKIDDVEYTELYAPNFKPNNRLDVMIYLNDTEPNQEWADKHILYMQNAYGKGSDTALKELRKRNYDGYAFISKKLLDLHIRDGNDGIFLPFGVDIELFYPREKKRKYCFDVAYVGSNIKGRERTERYLLPAAQFKFGLYGNWILPPDNFLQKIMFWRRNKTSKDEIFHYQKMLAKLSRGKIPQKEVPILYSSAKINLNFTAEDCVEWDVITLRTLEVLACRGFLLTDRVPVAEKTMHGCMAFTDGADDLIEKIEHYLSNEEEREKISQCGYEYAVKHASIDSRMDDLFDYLKKII